MSKLLLLTLPLALLLGCKKDDPDPVDQLPPATQTGANTFGCLLNGKAWTPKGYNGTPNYSVYYDPNFRKGTLNVAAYRYDSETDNSRQDIIIFSDSIKTTGSFPLTLINRQEALFNGKLNECRFRQNEQHYRRGTLTITRLDIQAGIISGTFDFVLAKPGCDTIKVTQGRFDKRL